MKITPKTEEEVGGAWELLPDGEYPFTVLESDEIASKSAKNKGKMMFAVKLNVHAKDGDYHVYDYFSDWFSEWKLRHFAATTGQLDSYEKGDLNGATGAFNGKVGYVKIARERNEKYGDKNVVKDYIVRDAAPKSAPPAQEPDTSDVPF